MAVSASTPRSRTSVREQTHAYVFWCGSLRPGAGWDWGSAGTGEARWGEATRRAR